MAAVGKQVFSARKLIKWKVHLNVAVSFNITHLCCCLQERSDVITRILDAVYETGIKKQDDDEKLRVGRGLDDLFEYLLKLLK